MVKRAWDTHPVIDNIPGLFAILAPDGTIETANRRITEYCGQSPEEIRNWGTNGTLHPDDLDEFARVFQESIISGAPYHVEARVRRHDGVYRWFDSEAAPVRDASGSIVCWYVLLTDIEHLKRAELALRESQRDLKLTIDTAPVLIWQTDAQGSAQLLSKYYLDYVGVAPDDLPRFRWQAAVHPDDLVGLRTTWKAIMASGKAGEAEARLRRYDGEYRWFLFRANPMRDADGNAVKWFGVNTDIEDRKRAEASLHEALDHLNEGQRLSQTGSYIADLGKNIHIWSDEFYRICELPIGLEIKTETLAAIVLPEDLAFFTGAIEQAMAGTQADFEFRIRTQSGALKHLHGVARRISVEPVFAGAVTDITERKKSERRLRQSESFQAKAQELSLTGSFAWSSASPDGFTFSDQLYRTFDFPPGSAITSDMLSERYHPEDRYLLAQGLDAARSGAPIDFEHRIVLPTGEIKHLHVYATMAPKHSDITEYFGAVQDVTQRRLSQDALEKVRGELEHATRVMSLGTLTASIAHEVNQPLSGIITNASTGLRMLEADPPNIAGAMETARRTMRDGRRASEVIARLRALFGKAEFATSTIDLNKTAAEVVELMLHDLKRHRIVITTTFDPRRPLVLGDRVQLQQVFLNLIMNAADAVKALTDRSRQIFVSTHMDNAGRVSFAVCDNGVGIPADDFSKLFDPFFTTKTEGMGIGLSVSQGIVERHKGRLSAAPNTEFGVTFLLSLPGIVRAPS